MLETVLTIILVPIALIALLLTIALAIGAIKALFGKKETTTIYCGSEDRAELAESILKATKTDYAVKVVDGEYEILLKL